MTEFLFFFSPLCLSPAPPCPIRLLLSVVMTHSRILAHSPSSPHSMCLSRVLLTGSVTCVQFISSPLVSAHISEFWVTALSWTSLWKETELCPYSDLFPQGVPDCQVHCNEYLSSDYPGIEAQEGDTQDCFRDGASLVKRRMDYKISHGKNSREAPVVLWKGWVLIQDSDPGEGANRVQIWELFPRQKQWDFGTFWRLESKAGEEIRVAFMQ